jgi:phosphatidylinositol kinase/protein kinase (PI-3  family)
MVRVMGGSAMQPASISEAWRLAAENNRQRVWASAMWEIWKERNARIFRQEAQTQYSLHGLIMDNISKWIQAYDN